MVTRWEGTKGSIFIPDYLSIDLIDLLAKLGNNPFNSVRVIGGRQTDDLQQIDRQANKQRTIPN